MGNRFNRSREALSKDEQDSLDQALERNPFRYRISGEEHLSENLFKRFLRKLSQRKNYEDICYDHLLQGERLRGNIPLYLFRFVDASKWGRYLLKENGITGIDPIEYLENFSQLSDNDRRVILSKVTIGRVKSPVFATFSMSVNNALINELGDVQVIRDVLGLNINSGRFICLIYESNNFKNPLFPTCADAGNHPYFHPARQGFLYGFTWNLRTKRQIPLNVGEIAQRDKSVPEVVHENKTAGILRDFLPILLPGEIGPLPVDLPDVVPECEIV